MAKKKKKTGAELFDRFYRDIYQERWDGLKEALEKPVRHMEYQPAAGGETYFLDRASWTAASCLPVEEGMDVLDLCAAPGGKSLILSAALKGTGTLTCNEISPSRRTRLAYVLENHLPEEWRQSTRVTGYDGTRWCLHEQNAYDAVLLDAPCSSERHLLHSPAHMKTWTPARTKNLAVREYSLAVSALDAVRPGGWLLYSTCSLSPIENDGIIEKMMKKRKGRFEVIRPEVPEAEAEPTEYGCRILPDREGWGPIYFCLMKKTEIQEQPEE